MISRISLLDALELNNYAFQEIEKMHTIVVSNPNLEFFGVHLPCSDMTMTWMNFIDKFPLLEKLIINDCSRLQKLHISQPNLVSLVLKDSIVLWEVRIDSPKLKSLEYKGGLTYFKGIEDLQELEFVLLYLDPFKLCDYWYSWFRDILESCAHS
ncbi:hypothetical protein AABB24_012968 [Solanum stoloniferum]|uniref:Uncharacterized protein n=1 Tax=Solanum stoloniferum TaxID=62892 RepID=A0ABD2U601_9SOLN